METFEDRLRRFLANSPNEIFGTILNSISNCTLPDLQAAIDGRLYHLALLGIHSVMQTIGEQIYGEVGLSATTFCLKHFVDSKTADTKFSEIASKTADTKFSEIAEELHRFRNAHAHRWSSRFNHEIGFDTSQEKGWWCDENGLHINPVILMKCFSEGFRTGGPMWTTFHGFDELTAVQRKYRYLRQWLELEKDTNAFRKLRALETLGNIDDVRKKEEMVQDTIMAHFGFVPGGTA